MSAKCQKRTCGLMRWTEQPKKRRTGWAGRTNPRGGFVGGKQDGAHFDVDDIAM